MQGIIHPNDYAHLKIVHNHFSKDFTAHYPNFQKGLFNNDVDFNNVIFSRDNGMVLIFFWGTIAFNGFAFHQAITIFSQSDY